MTNSVIYLEWTDSAALHGWQSKTVSSEDLCPVEIKSIGFLVKKTRTHVTISASDSNGGHFDSPISIPRKAITKLQKVDLPNSPRQEAEG